MMLSFHLVIIRCFYNSWNRFCFGHPRVWPSLENSRWKFMQEWQGDLLAVKPESRCRFAMFNFSHLPVGNDTGRARGTSSTREIIENGERREWRSLSSVYAARVRTVAVSRKCVGNSPWFRPSQRETTLICVARCSFEPSNGSLTMLRKHAPIPRWSTRNIFPNFTFRYCQLSSSAACWNETQAEMILVR